MFEDRRVIQHPLEQPDEDREPEIDAEELMKIPDDVVDLPVDEAVDEATRGE